MSERGYLHEDEAIYGFRLPGHPDACPAYSGGTFAVTAESAGSEEAEWVGLAGDAPCPICRWPLVAQMGPWGPWFPCGCTWARLARLAEEAALAEAAAAAVA